MSRILVLSCSLIVWTCVWIPAAMAQGLFMNPFEERAIGEQGHPEAVARDGGEHPNRALSTYIRSIGSEAAYSSARHPDQFVFTTLNNPSFNAYARPGGFLYVHVGILGWMNDESEFMALMGHEVGHAISRHSAREFNRENVANTLGRLAERRRQRRGESSEDLEEKKIQAWLALKEYGRDQEFESDDISLNVLIKTKRDPAAATRMLTTLVRFKNIMDKITGGGGDEVPPHARSHPPGIDRVRRAATRLNESGATGDPDLRYRDRFLDAIDGLIVPAHPLYLDQSYMVKVHTVQPGETVASLSQRMQTFPVIQEDMFRAVNGMNGSARLVVGQRVKLFVAPTR